MTATKYVIWDRTAYIARDDSTGPMSTGGYPYAVNDLWRTTKWDSREDAEEYLSHFNYPQALVLECSISTGEVFKVRNAYDVVKQELNDGGWLFETADGGMWVDPNTPDDLLRRFKAAKKPH